MERVSIQYLRYCRCLRYWSIYNKITAGSDIIANYAITVQYLEISQTSTFRGDISAPNIYNKTQLNELLIGPATSSDTTSAITGQAGKSTTYTNNNVNKLLLQNTEGAFQVYDYTDPNNVYSGGVISNPTQLVFGKIKCNSPY